MVRLVWKHFFKYMIVNKHVFDIVRKQIFTFSVYLDYIKLTVGFLEMFLNIFELLQ